MVQFMNLVSAKVLPNYMLALEFEDGARKVFDFKKELDFLPFVPLKNIRLFGQAKSIGSAVVLNDDIDIAAEYLYEHGKDIKDNQI